MKKNSSVPALPAGPSEEVEAAFDLLGLDPETATIDDVETAFIDKVTEYHPETGGSYEAFIRLMSARQTARVYLL